MEKKCSVGLCDNIPGFVCLCNSSFICVSHIAEHLLTQKEHKYVLFSRPANKQSQDLVLAELLKHLNNLSLLSKKVLNESSLLIKEILKLTTEFIQQIGKLEESVRNSLEMISKNLESKSNTDDYLHSLCYESLDTVKKELSRWSFPLITPGTRKVLKELESLFKLEFVKLPYILPENKFLYFFADDSVQLNSFNTEKSTIQCFRLPLKQNRGAAGTTCYLPGSKIFYGGGIVKNKTIANYIIIDEASGEVAVLNGGRARKQGGSCVYDGKVWIYGGCEGDRAMKNCENFDLTSMRWQDFTDLPSCSDTSVCLFDNQLFVTGGQLHTVLQHFPDKNAYLNIFDGLSNKNKFICSGFGKLYLIYEDQIFISDNWNQFKWTSLPLGTRLGKYWVCTWVMYKGSIYFTTGHYSLFNNTWAKARKLDLKTFQLTDII